MHPPDQAAVSDELAPGPAAARARPLLQTICNWPPQKNAPPPSESGAWNLLHQQHLPGAFNRAIQPSLVVGRQAGVFAGQDAPGVGDELPEQIDVFEIERVGREVNLGLGSGGARFRGPSAARTAARFVNVGLARHKGYLISRCRVCRRRNGLYFLSSIFSVFTFLLR